MIKIIKSNKFISLLLLIMCIIIIINPSSYAKSCLNGVSVWALKVFPLMFPFFILTKMIASLNTPKENFMDKFFNKVYYAPNGSFSTFFLSTLSGYPMGAKLIAQMHENKQINSTEAKKMLSFCSVSGPMFMIGTVGVAMLSSFKAGVIILISNMVASLLNGFIHRGKKQIKKELKLTNNNQSISFSDCVHDSLISVLMVGAYIVVSFIFIDLLRNLHITSFISNAICNLFKCESNFNVVQSVLNGIIEITRGIFDLSNSTLSLQTKTIISSGLIGFGGVSILLQSVSFLNKIKVPIKSMIIQKTTQGIICLIISFILCILFL